MELPTFLYIAPFLFIGFSFALGYVVRAYQDTKKQVLQDGNK